MVARTRRGRERGRVLLLIPNEQRRVPALPHLLVELGSHQLLPVRFMPDVSPEGDVLPVDDRLGMGIAVLASAAVALPEPPRDDLKVGLWHAGVVEQAHPVLGTLGKPSPLCELVGITLGDHQLRRFGGPYDGKR